MLHLIVSREPLHAIKRLLTLLIIPSAILFYAVQVFASGTLDPSFGKNGEARPFFSIPYWPGVSALQHDGKIVIVSSALDSSYDFSIDRYNSNGTVDHTFGRDGRVYADFTQASDRPMALAIQPDGKIIVAGYIFAYLPSYGTDLILARYHSDGSLDHSFGNGGIVITDRSRREEIHAIALQPDGKIVVAGSAYLTTETCGLRFLLGRYSNEGVLDSSFGSNGISYTPFGNCVNYPTFNAEFNAVSIGPDGKIIAGGIVWATWDCNYVVARFNSSGTREFLTSIRSGQENSVGFKFVSTLPDGKILAIGEKVARFLSDGGLDPTFALNQQLALRTAFSHGNAMLLPDGKILWHSAYSPQSTFVDYVRVLSRNGGVVGELRLELPSEFVSSVLAQPDGKIIVISDVMRRYLNISSMAGRQTDFNGDYKSDVAYFRPSDGNWAIYSSIGHDVVSSVRFGQQGDYPTPGSFVSSFSPASSYGGSRAMVAVYRPSTGVWYLNRMCGVQLCYRVLGATGDVPVGGDYDGDGMDDFALFKDGAWKVLMSNDNSKLDSKWGTIGDQPVPGDYDFDGFTDLAVYRPGNGTWYVSLSSNGSSLIQRFGDLTDRPVPGDYDGDGRTDFAVFRPANGYWYILKSRDGSLTAQRLGIATDRPVPGDYDGDGRTDIAVFRNGFWYILRSSAGFTIVKWGATDTIPLTPGYSAD